MCTMRALLEPHEKMISAISDEEDVENGTQIFLLVISNPQVRVYPLSIFFSFYFYDFYFFYWTTVYKVHTFTNLS